MGQKLHTPKVVQDLLDLAMTWAQAQLRDVGEIPAALVTTPADGGAPTLKPSLNAAQPIADQESVLLREVWHAWQQGSLAAIALVAPVLFGKSGAGERSCAVRLHLEASGYCADILMPYRIRPAPRWRGKAQNRVHFSHPVAQEAESWLGGLPSSTVSGSS